MISWDLRGQEGDRHKEKNTGTSILIQTIRLVTEVIIEEEDDSKISGASVLEEKEYSSCCPSREPGHHPLSLTKKDLATTGVVVF